MDTPSSSRTTSYDFNADFADLRTASDWPAGDLAPGWNIEGDMYPPGFANGSPAFARVPPGYAAHTSSVAGVNHRCVTPASYQNFAALASSDPQSAMPSIHKHFATPASAAGNVDYSDICWVNPFAPWHAAKAIDGDAHVAKQPREFFHPTSDTLSSRDSLPTSLPLSGVAHSTPLLPPDPRTPLCTLPLPLSATARGPAMAPGRPFVVGKTCEEAINDLFRSLPSASNAGELLDDIVV
ncbi:hypothetical protein K525DRAFT_193434 [Schizophyllum commune Loenen D]|nr:hypothetical protein K525DRAFT_193434 [Schizophyllum commune Loenen D]